MQNDYVILCVDDEEDSISVFEEAAASLGFTAVSVSNAVDAVDYIAKHNSKIVLVLADYSLANGETGFDVRRQTMSYSEIPFAVISGYVTRELALEGVAYKIEAFLDKPLDIGKLGTTVANAVASRKSDLEFKEEVKSTFLEEADGLLDELESMLLVLESSPGDTNLFNGVFRIIHTIKGSSAVLDTQDVSQFAHKFEDFLQVIRSSGRVPSPRELSRFLQGLDGLKTLINCATTNSPPPTELPSFDLEDESQPSIESSGANQGAAGPQQHVTRLVKVPVEVLDRLEHHTAEVTIQKNMISKLITSLQREQPTHSGITMLAGFFDEMVKHHAGTQSEIGKIRTTPFSEIVRPLTRVVRDLEKLLGKSALLNIVGGATLVDYRAKKIMSECFIHLIRNCLDHGIESVEERQQLGKPERSEIMIEARESGQSVEILIRDDGKGIDPQRVRDKASANNVLAKDELHLLSDAQVIDLIFAPGFSTAEKISDTSGRGVGMDMVRTSLNDIGGSVSVTSQIGVGTTVRLLIPKQELALSIDSLLVRVGHSIYAIAQQSIGRLCDLKIEGSIKRVEHEGAISIDIGERLLPLISLEAFLRGETLQLDMIDFDSKEDVKILVIKDQGGPPFALWVDEILDIEEVVIRPVSSYVDVYNLYKGAALLNNGAVGLILDVAGIAAKAGISEVNEAIGESQVAERAAEKYSQYLLVEGDAGRKFAINQENVFRVETVVRRDIGIATGRSVLKYRNHIAPIFSLTGYLGVASGALTSPNIGDPSAELSVVVVKGKKGFSIYIVANIIDVVGIAEAAVLGSVGADARFKGHVFIGDEMYSVVSGEALTGDAQKPNGVAKSFKYTGRDVRYG